jgi:hypothetical protein
MIYHGASSKRQFIVKISVRSVVQLRANCEAKDYRRTAYMVTDQGRLGLGTEVLRFGLAQAKHIWAAYRHHLEWVAYRHNVNRNYRISRKQNCCFPIVPQENTVLFFFPLPRENIRFCSAELHLFPHFLTVSIFQGMDREISYRFHPKMHHILFLTLVVTTIKAYISHEHHSRSHLSSPYFCTCNT